jgi:hypothetical protein
MIEPARAVASPLTDRGERVAELFSRYEAMLPPRSEAERQTFLAWSLLDLTPLAQQDQIGDDI